MLRVLNKQYTYYRSTIRLYSGLILRDYQQDAINCCINAIKSGKNRIGVSLATGGGKTVIFSNLINELRLLNYKQKHRTLVLVHRRELALQASRTIKRLFPDLHVEIEMGKQISNVKDSDVIVASVQSLSRRLDKYAQDDIDLIIIDEAHHAVANTYVNILNHFNAATKTSRKPVIGFSATFERADNKALSAVLDEIIYHRGIIDMINDKWLCEGKFTTVKVDVDFSKVDSTSMDFKLDSLSQVMNTKEVTNIILKSYMAKRQENNLRSTLLFGVDVKHVKSLHEAFLKNNINTRYVTAQTKESERDFIIQEFKEGKIEVLMNCGIFTEGTDIPSIDCILLCRPTKSRAMLVQMIGRGLRLHRDKEHCHIIDFIGAQNVGVVSVPTLTGIESYDGELNDALLSDLHDIKVQLEAQKVAKEVEKKEATESYNQAVLQFKELIKNTDALDLTLTSYDSFKNFYERSKIKGDLGDLPDHVRESKLIADSQYPWVRFTNNAWGLSLQNGNHLRLYREAPGKDRKHTQYILKLIREIPKYIRESTDIRFIPKQIIKDEDLAKICGKVDEVIEEMKKPLNAESAIKQSPRNFSKYARWRKEPATQKQRDVIYKRLLKEFKKNPEKFKFLKDSDVMQYVSEMTKGSAANLLFGISLAPVFPLNSLLRALNFKHSN